MLKAQKAEVSSFAEYAKTLGNVKLNTEELLSEKEYIKSLYGILQKIKIDNPLMAEIGRGYSDLKSCNLPSPPINLIQIYNQLFLLHNV